MGDEGSNPESGGASAGSAGRRWLIVALVLVGVAAAASWLAATLRDRDAQRAAHPQVSGALELPGLERRVQIDRDRRGVPHIEAETERDAFFALGFSHAQDRLAQIVALRERARGTAAEHAGPVALDGDRLARLIDFRGLAERQYGQLARGTRRVLEAYAAGIEARMERVRRGESAPPAALAGRELEPWTAQDSLALFKLFAWGLSSSIDASLVLNELTETLGASQARRFFPRSEAPEASGGRKTAALPTPRGNSEPRSWVLSGVSALRSAWGLSGPGVGSTAFVLGGAHTDSGRPVLVADSHFEPTAPAALYLAHLRSPGYDVAGATLPGVPLFWWGRNPRLAWANVNIGAVVTDLYTETLRKEGSEYHDGRRWQPVDERVEVMRVYRGADTTFAVRQTGHGPLLPSEVATGGEAIAVSWSGSRTDGPSGIGSLLALARSRNGDALRESLRDHREPAIAVVWAESSGGAGLQVAGWIPKRSLAAQLLPLPGRARWYRWEEAIDFDSLPADGLDDGRGFLVAADQHFQGDDDEARIDAVWRSGARAKRLRALLGRAAKRGSSLRRLAAVQADVALLRSRELVEAALALVEDREHPVEAEELVALLRQWDGQAEAGSSGSAIYHVFLDVLADALFAEALGKELFGGYLALPDVDLESLVLSVLRDAADGGVDAWSEPARVSEAVAESLREAWLSLSFRLGPDPRRWLWGRIHPLRFRGAPGFSDLGPFPYGGATHAVQTAAHSPADPFAVRVAATARFAIDADSLDLAMVALAPGQSEHPGHPHYDDGLAGWLAGRHALIATRRLEVEDRSVARLVLEPVR